MKILKSEFVYAEDGVEVGLVLDANTTPDVVIVNGTVFSSPASGTVMLQPTEERRVVNGQPTRRWAGQTAGGVEVEVFVAFFRVKADGDIEAFEEEFPRLERRKVSMDDPTIPEPL